jgi:hypothetical protein
MEQAKKMTREEYLKVLNQAFDEHEFFLLNQVSDTQVKIQIAQIMARAAMVIRDHIEYEWYITTDRPNFREINPITVPEILSYLNDWINYSGDGRGD